jgi:hypothetical protein
MFRARYRRAKLKRHLANRSGEEARRGGHPAMLDFSLFLTAVTLVAFGIIAGLCVLVKHARRRPHENKPRKRVLLSSWK